MRKTLLTIATIGLLGLSTMSGVFAQTVAAIDAAETAAANACGPTGSPAACAAAVLNVRAAFALAVTARVITPAVAAQQFTAFTTTQIAGSVQGTSVAVATVVEAVVPAAAEFFEASAS